MPKLSWNDDEDVAVVHDRRGGSQDVRELLTIHLWDVSSAFLTAFKTDWLRFCQHPANGGFWRSSRASAEREVSTSSTVSTGPSSSCCHFFNQPAAWPCW